MTKGMTNGKLINRNALIKTKTLSRENHAFNYSKFFIISGIKIKSKGIEKRPAKENLTIKLIRHFIPHYIMH